MWTPERGDAPMTPTSRGSPLSSVRPSLLCQSEHYYTFTMTYDCVWDSLISGSCFLSLSVFCLCHSLPPASVDGNLYAGVHVDFMGTDPAIFRTMGSGPATRTEQYDSRWLNGTSQISSHLISYVVQIVQIELTVSWILTSAVGSGCFTWACCVLIAYTCIPLSKYFLAHLALHLDTPPSHSVFPLRACFHSNPNDSGQRRAQWWQALLFLSREDPGFWRQCKSKCLGPGWANLFGNWPSLSASNLIVKHSHMIIIGNYYIYTILSCLYSEFA